MLSPLWRWLRACRRSSSPSKPLPGGQRRHGGPPSLEQLEERAVPAIINPPNIVTGPDRGLPPRTNIFDATSGSLQLTIQTFRGDFTNGVRVALGDVNGDGIPDIIAGAGTGSGPRVRIYDGDTQAQIVNFRAFSKNARAGVFVAAGNFDSDAAMEVVVGAGSRARVRIFNIVNGAAVRVPGLLGDLFITRNGKPGTSTRVATGNVDGQAGDELIVTLGEGVTPFVRVYNANGALLSTFAAYDETFLGGVYVAVGDVDGNGTEEIITGPGTGAVSNVRIFNQNGSQLTTFRAFEEAFTGGARVAVVDADGDSQSDIVVGRGPGAAPQVILVDGVTLAQLDSFFAYDLAFAGGVFVSGT